VTLLQKQSLFARMIANLIRWATERGYEVTFGKPQAKHMEGSLHYISLALDLNLFRDGEYLTRTEDHKPLGEYWESIGGTWGGRFGDGNHYSLAHGGRK
jgi:hypothetical protein